MRPKVLYSKVKINRLINPNAGEIVKRDMLITC